MPLFNKTRIYHVSLWFFLWSNHFKLTLSVGLYNPHILLKTHKLLSASRPCFSRVPISFINKLWCPAETPFRQRCTNKKKKTWASADIIKLFCKLPDPFSLQQFTSTNFLCLWKTVYSWTKGGGWKWLDLKTPPCDAGTHKKNFKCWW